MKRLQLALMLGLAVTVGACAGDTADEPNATDPNATTVDPARDPADAVGTTGAANADRSFIQDQLEDGHAEVSLGKLAEQRAANPQVKNFAQMMVREHQMAGEELRQVATTNNVTIEPVAENLDGDHQELQNELMELSGREFDRRYIQAMVEEHEEAVNELETKVNDENAATRAWAAKTLPKIRQHLEQARQIQQTLERAG